MGIIRLLLDTGVWISYFGDRQPPDQKVRIDLSKNIINYCMEKNIKLFYCPYVVMELRNGNNKDRAKNIENMKKIAEELPGYIGNDTWDQLTVLPWNKWDGSSWNNVEEVAFGNKVQEQLPDKKGEEKKIDRNILITAKMQKINAILHENPADFKRFDQDDLNGLLLLDLLQIQSLDEFIQKISSLNK